tara:strand:- start:286 stop:663 length:378 start_codon:yes stop_codon:yes gene_type:complete
VRLIKYRLEQDVQLSLRNDIDFNSDDKDIRELKFKSKTKNDIYKADKIHFMNEFEVDEISFEINHSGSSKTFYLKEKSNMRANIDVSSQLNFIDGKPTQESMIKVGVSLINEILGFNSSGLDEVA